MFPLTSIATLNEHQQQKKHNKKKLKNTGQK